jgi:hypothetical protein
VGIYIFRVLDNYNRLAIERSPEAGFLDMDAPTIPMIPYDDINKDFETGVRVSLGLISLIKPSSLGFTALRIPFHRDPYPQAPPS